MNDTCPDCYGSGVDHGEKCNLCRGKASREYLAAQARFNAAHTYRGYVRSYLDYGIRMYDVDSAAAMASWLDGMASLDAALEVEKEFDTHE